MQGRRSQKHAGSPPKEVIQNNQIKQSFAKTKQNKKVELQQIISPSRKRGHPSKKIFNNYNFRFKKPKNYNDLYGDQPTFENEDQDFQLAKQSKQQNGSKKKESVLDKQKRKQSEILNRNEIVEYDRLPNRKSELVSLLQKIDIEFYELRKQWFYEQSELPTKISNISSQSVSIYADVKQFDFKKLIREQLKLTGRLFDAIMMDPPWQLSTSQPSRGVTIGYDSLSDDFILSLPIPQLQKHGFIFIWTINAKYRTAARCIQNWGYTLIDEIVWVKKTVNGKIAKGHGYYLQHAKENCLIGVKGRKLLRQSDNIQSNDIIWSERRGQSQKPEQIYEIIEEMIPEGFYLEIFGRRNNLRPRWVTIGNEI